MLAVPDSGSAATVVVNNNDGAGEGFNDPAAFVPVGGNNAVTVGAARLAAFQFAAGIWGSFLESSVVITIDAEFNGLFCDPSSAVLGSAGAQTIHGNFGAALPYPPELFNTWYPQALANAMDGSDLNPAADASAQFNSNINGNPACLGGRSWYYGLDGNPPGLDIDFVSVLLHELGHSIGFQTYMNLANGTLNSGIPDTYLTNMECHPTAYTAMTDAQRDACNTNGPNLHFVGGDVTAEGTANLTAGVSGGHVQLFAPAVLAPGSSVAHFDTALTPDELMEPAYTGPNHEVGLAEELMRDIGWRTFEMDLWGRDEATDTGVEPNPTATNMWQSPDIWVRKDQDTVAGARSTGPVYANEHNHEDAEFKAVGTNYLYVKVRSRGARNSADEHAELKVYFAKAGTGLNWPTHWVGYSVAGTLYGDIIATVPIPPIAEGEEWVAEIPWTVPDPADFASFGADQNHFCLLARVETDPAAPYGMTTAEGASVNANTRNNNNIWWKNIKVYDLNPADYIFESNFLVGNPREEAGVFDIQFRPADGQAPDRFLDIGKVEIQLGEARDRWLEAGAKTDGARYNQETGRLQIFNPEGAWVRGIPFGPMEQEIVGLEFEVQQFPQEKRFFQFSAVQYTQGRDEPDGGVTMNIRWDPGHNLPVPALSWFSLLILSLLLALAGASVVFMRQKRAAGRPGPTAAG